MSATCDSCGAELRWGFTLSGAKMPLDAEPSPAKGTWLLLRPDSEKPLAIQLMIPKGTKDGVEVEPLARQAAQHQGVPLREPHWATCPTAAEHRRRQPSPLDGVKGDDDG